MKKRPIPAWALCLLVTAFTLYTSRFAWLPITENSGTHYVRVLEEASDRTAYIALDFGYSRDFHIARNDKTEALLEASALGQEYAVTARYHSGRRASSKYYIVLALTGPDGTVYRTIEESEANRQAALPQRLLLFAALDAVCCTLLILRWRRKSNTSSQNAKEATP